MGQPSGEGGIGAAGDLSPLCVGWRTQWEVRPGRALTAPLPPPLTLTAATAAPGMLPCPCLRPLLLGCRGKVLPKWCRGNGD